jgi:hypothetical protein
VPRGTMSSLEELDLRNRKWRTQTLREVNNRGKLRSHRINRRRLNDERLNNNLYSMQSSEVDTICRGATKHRMIFVIRSGSIHQLNTIQIAEFECINISSEF